MIAFDLECVCGCQFEGWFKSRNDFEQQISSHLLVCPECASSDIHKILSPVAVHSGSSESAAVKHDVTPDQVLDALRTLQDYVEKNFEDVGPRMAEESLKIRYGVTEPRNIRGVTTADEEKILQEEGIELLKIPIIKKPSGPKPN